MNRERILQKVLGEPGILTKQTAFLNSAEENETNENSSETQRETKKQNKWAGGRHLEYFNNLEILMVYLVAEFYDCHQFIG